MARKKITTLKSFDSVDAALLKLGQRKAFIQQAEGKMNEEIQTIRDRFEKETNQAQQEVLALEEDLEVFCIQNKEEFETRRTKEMVHGRVGFRTAPPSVRLLNRKYNWETVLELLKKVRFGRLFLRTVEQVDKEKILAAHAAKEVDDQKLAAVGIKIDQPEDFVYEIKWDEIPND